MASQDFSMASQGIQWATAADQREAQLLQMIEELQRQVMELREATSQRTTSKPRQVLPEPERFNGRAKEWDTWSMEIQAKLRIDGRAIGNADAQLHYVYALLGRSVQGLVLPFMQKAKEKGPLELLEYLERIYDDPNKAKKAGQQLRELQQGSMSLTTYLPKFERTLFEAGGDTWPDDAKITTLVGGLNKETRHRLNGQLTLPAEYNAFVRTLLSLGNHFSARFLNGNNSNAMDWEQSRISKMKVAPSVSPEQRQQWRDEGKCVRCGSKKHWVQQCKLQAARQRSSSSDSRSSSSPQRSLASLASDFRKRTGIRNVVVVPTKKITARKTGSPVSWGKECSDDSDCSD